MLYSKANLFHRVVLISLILVMLLYCSAISVKADSVVFAFESFNYELIAGKKAILTPILQGAELSSKAKYTWESEDATIATVNKGTVTAKAAGSTKISCTVQDKEASYTASCTVHVLQPVTKIQFDEKDWKMAEDHSAVWQPEVLPANAYNKQLRFSSSEPSVATISETGIIKALDRGVTTITAEATDGSGVKLEKKLTVVTFIMDIDEIVLSERKTYVLQIPKLKMPNNLNAYYIRTKNQNFDLGEIDINKKTKCIHTYGEKYYIEINPVKAGTGTLVLMDDNAYYNLRGTKASQTIKITVEPSATYSKESFPPIDFSKASADYKSVIGSLVSVKGTVSKIDVLPYDKNNVQILYTVAVEGKTPKSVLVITPPEINYKFIKEPGRTFSKKVPKDGDFIIGDKVEVYGCFIEAESSKTETGLLIQTPKIQAEKINDICYNDELHKLAVYDITQR